MPHYKMLLGDIFYLKKYVTLIYRKHFIYGLLDSIFNPNLLIYVV
jgi:hypothetical protein